MLNAHHVDHVVEVLDGIEDGGLGHARCVGAKGTQLVGGVIIDGVLDEESMIERYLCHASRIGEGTQLSVGQVARMVAQGAG